MRYEMDCLSTTTIPWYKFTKKKGTIQRPCHQKGVRRLEMATDACSRDVHSHVVRTSIVVAPGGNTVGAAAAPTPRPNAVASTQPLSPDPAQSPGSAWPQPMDCNNNHPGPDDTPGLHSTPCSGTRGVAELRAQQGVCRDTVQSTARGGHVFAALAVQACNTDTRRDHA
jgi:hypothetical protein